jgi:hypothetical protein
MPPHHPAIDVFRFGRCIDCLQRTTSSHPDAKASAADRPKCALPSSAAGNSADDQLVELRTVDTVGPWSMAAAIDQAATRRLSEFEARLGRALPGDRPDLATGLGPRGAAQPLDRTLISLKSIYKFNLFYR